MNTFRAINSAFEGDTTTTDTHLECTRQTAAHSAALQTFCQELRTIPSFDLSALDEETRDMLPELEANLEAARDHAIEFLDEVNPEMWGLISQIAGYSSVFRGFNLLMLEALDKWEAGNEEGKTDLLKLLDALRTESDGRKDAAMVVIEDLKRVRGNFSSDQATFASDALIVNSILGGDEGVLADIQQEIDSLTGTIAGSAVGVALGSLTIIGGVLVILAGAVVSVVTAGGGSGIIIWGSGITAVGAGTTIASAVTLGRALDTKRELLAKQTQLEGNVAALMNVGMTLGSLGEMAAGAIGVLNNLVSSWVTLSGTLGQFVEIVEGAQTFAENDSGLLVRGYIASANLQWEMVADRTAAIQTQFSSIEVRTVDQLDQETLLAA